MVYSYLIIPHADEVLISDTGYTDGTGIENCLMGNTLDRNGDVCWNIRLRVFPIVDLEAQMVPAIMSPRPHDHHTGVLVQFELGVFQTFPVELLVR